MKRKLKETVLKNNVTRPTFGNKTYKLKRSIMGNGKNTFLFIKTENRAFALKRIPTTANETDKPNISTFQVSAILLPSAHFVSF